MNICRILVRASGSHHLWKRAYTTVGSPAPMTANKMFDGIKNLTAGSYLDLISRDQRNNGYYLSEADLVGCANLLCNDGKDEIALEIRGHVAANDLFQRVEPNFEKMNPGDLKNWPANRKLLELMKQKSMENFCARLQFHTMMLEKASPITLAYPKENLEDDDLKTRTLEHMESEENLEKDGPVP
ncbi:unnamed protein product [Arabis nemorensis]|uniref:Uncharacterized protein n=1 Tax=Arabis nemorensis TaxID=586526 RepID=A0A565AMQ5_9BRAS|nr:unnamed protein product [Arabis nemorensis]